MCTYEKILFVLLDTFPILTAKRSERQHSYGVGCGTNSGKQTGNPLSQKLKKHFRYPSKSIGNHPGKKSTGDIGLYARGGRTATGCRRRTGGCGNPGRIFRTNLNDGERHQTYRPTDRPSHDEYPSTIERDRPGGYPKRAGL